MQEQLSAPMSVVLIVFLFLSYRGHFITVEWYTLGSWEEIHYFIFDCLIFLLFSNTILSNAAMATTIVGTRSADSRWSVVRATLSLTVPNRSVMAFST